MRRGEATTRGASVRPFAAALLLSLVGCAPDKPANEPAAKPPAQRGAPIRFAYESLDDRPVSTEGVHGRATVVLFLVTYGDPSIIEARFVKKVLREHVPRINAAGIFLERIDNRPLARVFRDSLDLPFPLAMADEASIAGKGPFAGVDTVPTVVVLDAQGREVFRKVGVTYPGEIERALKEAQME